nr:biogenesis of lysosome-related organelles complex 1 subunit 1 [Agelaius phoeniceus]
MLSRLLKEHQARQSERRELQERRRRDAIAAATRLTEALVDHLNVGVAQAYVNQRKLDQEVKTLQVQAAQFARQTGQWIAMVESFNQALKVGKKPTEHSPKYTPNTLQKHCKTTLKHGPNRAQNTPPNPAQNTPQTHPQTHPKHTAKTL